MAFKKRQLIIRCPSSTCHGDVYPKFERLLTSRILHLTEYCLQVSLVRITGAYHWRVSLACITGAYRWRVSLVRIAGTDRYWLKYALPQLLFTPENGPPSGHKHMSNLAWSSATPRMVNLCITSR